MKSSLAKKGFTLLEIVVAVIIVCILASMAILYYYGAMERLRMAEVVTLIGTEISAQERRFLMSRRYTDKWHQLDVQPGYVRIPKADNEYANGAENTIFYTRGKDENGNPRNGYEIFFEHFGSEWFMTANRVGDQEYDYSLIRPFHDTTIYCIPAAGNLKSEVLCSDFMGVDSADLLPDDPRTAYREMEAKARTAAAIQALMPVGAVAMPKP